MEFEGTQTVIAGVKYYDDAAEAFGDYSAIEATEFVVPTALAPEGAATLMAALVTGAAATLLF